VFVHGLTGNRRSTWTSEDTNVCWPETLLPDALSKYDLQVRIFTFGYDADISGMLSEKSQNRLRNHGVALAQDLAMERKKTKTASSAASLSKVQLINMDRRRIVMSYSWAIASVDW
jgi:hypothetical protein